MTPTAAVAATSLTVSSITPSAPVASGASLLPLLTLTFERTPTDLTLSRADEPSVTAVVSRDTTQRGAFNLVNYVDTGNSSFLSLAVS